VLRGQSAHEEETKYWPGPHDDAALLLLMHCSLHMDWHKEGKLDKLNEFRMAIKPTPLLLLIEEDGNAHDDDRASFGNIWQKLTVSPASRVTPLILVFIPTTTSA
jgi:hypothetical protein